MPTPNLTPRPALGDVTVGQPVILIAGTGRTQTECPARIVKASRVWLTIRPDGPHGDDQERRCRRDTQRDGSDYAYSTQFRTLEQHAYDKALSDAIQFLREQDITVKFSSPWWQHNGRVLLADIIRKAVQ